MDQLNFDQLQASAGTGGDLTNSKSLASLSGTSDTYSYESEMNRQDIATGGPIVARESVFKYQMAVKEDQYTLITDFR